MFCEVLEVPGKCGESDLYCKLLDAKVADEEILLLPVTCILETGNHIGQCRVDGNMRRATAERFVETVVKAIKGYMPFTHTQFVEAEKMLEWLQEFPGWVQRNDLKGRGSGFGDLSIIKEWEAQCDFNPGRRVYIWSKDEHLKGYDRLP